MAGSVQQPLQMKAGSVQQPLRMKAGRVQQPLQMRAGSVQQPLHMKAGSVQQPLHMKVGSGAKRAYLASALWDGNHARPLSAWKFWTRICSEVANAAEPVGCTNAALRM